MGALPTKMGGNKMTKTTIGEMWNRIAEQGACKLIEAGLLIAIVGFSPTLAISVGTSLGANCLYRNPQKATEMVNA